MVKKQIVILLCLAAFPLFAQKRGSSELGGGISFWSKTVADSSVSNLDLLGLYSYYFNRKVILELLPSVTLNFKESVMDVNGLAVVGLSYKLIDLSNLDREDATQYLRKFERSTGAIFAFAGGGMWLESGVPKQPIGAILPAEKKTYSNAALSAGIVTRSMLGSLTNLRTGFQYVYLFPSAPYAESGRSMFSVSVMFSVISRL
ncbi:MAG: hypothetical protein ONB12_05910 [candidate division KSB1 bacterium]|nr:hypothetical protein [candidate division KSB1 bacterium]